MCMVEKSALNSRIISFDFDNYWHVDLDELQGISELDYLMILFKYYNINRTFSYLDY